MAIPTPEPHPYSPSEAQEGPNPAVLLALQKIASELEGIADNLRGNPDGLQSQVSTVASRVSDAILLALTFCSGCQYRPPNCQGCPNTHRQP